MMPLLSDYTKNKKIHYFFKNIAKNARILEVGSGNGWLKEYFTQNHYTNYSGIDLLPPADIVGSILDWKRLGIEKESFDYIIAFEVIEHVNCIQECFDLLKQNGKLFMTSPVPKMDWLLCFLEKIGLNQKRTSEHINLTIFADINIFREKQIRIVAGLSQWGIFTK
jgi:2-polyprenyl-3-methyl-5-hydroxy-6-metoxy-1,4-benzoquinol methylase